MKNSKIPLFFNILKMYQNFRSVISPL